MDFKDFLTLQEMAAKKSTNRLVKMAQDKDRLIVVIAASRGGVEVEPHATAKLAQEIRNGGFTVFKDKTGFGVTPTWGVYKEPGRDADKEKSLFVSWPKGKPTPPNEELVKFFVALAEKYQQIGLIIKLPGEEMAHEYFTSHAREGGEDKLGKRVPYLDPHKEEEPMYSTRPRFRGYGKGDAASKSDALTYSPDYDQTQQNPYV